MPQFTLDHGSAIASDHFHSLDAFTQAYIEAMFFTSTGVDDGDLRDMTLANLADETWRRIEDDCTKFQAANPYVLTDLEQAGHDFWLTRNGHGAGFWDGDWPEPQATELTDAAKMFGMSDLYLGDDGLLYLN